MYYIRKGIFFVLSGIVLSIYGAQVCPFIESLDRALAFKIYTSIFCVVSVFYTLALLKAQKRAESTLISFKSSLNLLLLELSFWLLAGVSITIWNYYNYNFPIILSGAKVLISCFVISLFSATYSLLSYENKRLKAFKFTSIRPVADLKSIVPVTNKIFFFFSILGVTVAVALLLLIKKDFDYVHVQFNKSAAATLQKPEEEEIERPETVGGPAVTQKQAMLQKQAMAEKQAMIQKQAMTQKQAMLQAPAMVQKQDRVETPAIDENFGLGKNIDNFTFFFRDLFLYEEVTREIFFVFFFIFAGLFMICRIYIKNINLLFRYQFKVYSNIKAGVFSEFVPVICEDEFGLMADQTNDMVINLKDKERIKGIFGKYISAPIANKILGSDKEVKLGGELKNIAILFTDLRGYTSLSEKLTATEVVSLLNEYFTLIISSIHKHNGALDKFIGDASMAIFGFNDGNGCDDALKCADDIMKSLEAFNEILRTQGRPTIENGIGIHWGEVVYGNIGSPDRLEFTIIGDAVNIASRLV
jgi:hypothetical protein